MQRLDYKWLVLIVVASGTFLVVLNQTIMNVALPRIMNVFGAGIDQAQLILTAFMLATAVIMPATSFLSERLGSKRLFLLTIALFSIGSLFCGLAWSLPSLIVARVLQGLGGGMIQPLGMAILFQVTPPHQRGTIMGLFALPVMIGPIFGPIVGGYLVEYADWRWIFFINLPIGLAGLLIGWRLLRETPTSHGRSFDYIGFALATICSSGALLGLSQAPARGWSHPMVSLALAVAAVTLPLFIWWELRTPQPLLNLRLFAIPAFAIAGVVNFVAMTTMFSSVFLIPVFLQNLRGLGPTQTGLMLVPQALASTVSILIGGRLFDLIGPRPLILIGLAIMIGSSWPLVYLDLTTSDATLIWLMTLRGAATGFLVMPAITAWLSSAPPHLTANASALNNVLRQLYSTFATAIFAWILQERTAFHNAYLAMQAWPEAPAIAQLLAAGQRLANQQGLSLVEGKSLVVAQLVGQFRLASAVRGFDDCFLVATLLAAVGVVPVLFMSGGPVGWARAARPAARAASLEPRPATPVTGRSSS